MSADQLAAAAIGAGVATLVCVFLMLLIVASVYQGAHAGRSEPPRVRQRPRDARRYHRKMARHSGRYPARAAAETEEVSRA